MECESSYKKVFLGNNIRLNNGLLLKNKYYYVNCFIGYSKTIALASNIVSRNFFR